jgi:uncharacterized protein YbaR (Trm112 family)
MSLIDPTLEAILVCPACKGDLDQDEERSVLWCVECDLGYPVRDGIPIMLADEAVER